MEKKRYKDKDYFINLSIFFAEEVLKLEYRAIPLEE